ncbi:IS3 family transposase [Rickettsia endosymbiont of Ceutorhynchus obstrictus]|uniref:IS3 family transposase n=1 Tax=Rickettsia endosymbiont of Ceutorhynchus obstrictus TaxID=3066249 RepID=UPI0031329E18
MKNNKEEFCIDKMAEVLGVSRAGYYGFIKRLASKRALDNRQLTEKIKEIFTVNYQTYGSPRIHAELREQGFVCSRPRVARLMSVTGIQAKMYKKFKKTTKQSNKPYHRG